jgi:hypothetical protein
MRDTPRFKKGERFFGDGSSAFFLNHRVETRHPLAMRYLTEYVGGNGCYDGARRDGRRVN